MDTKKTVTMYQISKELAFERKENFVVKDDNGNITTLKDNRNDFDIFKREQVKRLTELLKVKGVEKNAIKNGREFAIPIESKEYIKFLLLNFTSKPVKIIRKEGLEGLPYDEWSELVNRLVEYSTRDIQDIKKKEEIKNKILAEHQYFSIERHHRLINKISRLLKEAELRYGTFENLGNQGGNGSNQFKAGTESFSDELANFDEKSYKVRLLSENDVVELYNHLEKMIYQCFFEFEKVADIFSEIRNEEVEDKVIQAINENKNPDEIEYNDSTSVLEEALKEFQKNKRT